MELWLIYCLLMKVFTLSFWVFWPRKKCCFLSPKYDWMEQYARVKQKCVLFLVGRYQLFSFWRMSLSLGKCILSSCCESEKCWPASFSLVFLCVVWLSPGPETCLLLDLPSPKGSPSLSQMYSGTSFWPKWLMQKMPLISQRSSGPWQPGPARNTWKTWQRRMSPTPLLTHPASFRSFLWPPRRRKSLSHTQELSSAAWGPLCGPSGPKTTTRPWRSTASSGSPMSSSSSSNRKRRVWFSTVPAEMW